MKTILATTVSALFLFGCGAGFFSASTKASYHVIEAGGHDAEIKYESNKDQTGFAADYDPVTKKISVKVDSAKTSEAAIAASAEALAAMAKSFANFMDRLAPLLEKAAAMKGM